MAQAAVIALTVAFLGTVLIALLKGRWRTVIGGIVLIVALLPFLLLLAVLLAWIPMGVAAVRLARPRSWWARWFYDDEKRHRALARAEPDVLRIGGSTERTPEMTFRCEACGSYFRDETAAMAHADGFHTEMRFDDAKAALTRL